MDYRNNPGNDMPDQARRRMEETEEPQGAYLMHDAKKYGGKMQKGKMKNRGGKADAGQLEELYSMIDERMSQALCFHSQLADYFCFLGLQGFKRMAEYQYMRECAELRKMHRRYIDMHEKVLPMCEGEKPQLIPKDWSRYTTQDIDDSVIPRFVRMALKEWYEWEKETKEMYEEVCDQFQNLGMHADCEFVKDLITDAEKECKKIMRLYEKLNGTGYDVNTIHQVQDKYHEKYKKKYQDRFTVKNNYPQYDDMESRERRRIRRIGYV